jgi:hypothetical protein
LCPAARFRGKVLKLTEGSTSEVSSGKGLRRLSVRQKRREIGRNCLEYQTLGEDCYGKSASEKLDVFQRSFGICLETDDEYLE